MATYVNDLRLKEIATGDEAGTWGTSTNTNLELIAEAFSFGTEAITTNADTHTTTIADGSTDPGRSLFLKYTGTLDSTCTITIGPNTVSKLWFIENATSGSQSIIIKQGSGATVTIANGQTKAIYSDGAGSGAAMVDAFQDLSVPDLFVDDDLTIGDDLVLSSDSAVITFGADGDTTLTHTDGSGLTLNSTNKIMFNDASQFIQGSSATVLSLGATDEIDLTATLIDINGNADVSGNVTASGTLQADRITANGAGSSNYAVYGLQNGSMTHAGYFQANGDDIAIEAIATGGTYSSDVLYVRQSSLSTGGNLARFANSTGDKVVITTAGNVGIGTSSPSSYYATQLVVNGGADGGITVVNTTTGDGRLMFADGTSGSDRYTGQIFYNHANNYMAFGTNGGTERMRLDANGHLILKKNLVLESTSEGIDFSGVGASAQTLDDYEEGTWIPTNSGATLTVTNARYTKIGRLVNVSCKVFANANTAGDWGGLPFPIDVNVMYSGAVGYQNDTAGETWNVLADAGTSWTMRKGATSEQIASGNTISMSLTYYTSS